MSADDHSIVITESTNGPEPATAEPAAVGAAAVGVAAASYTIRSGIGLRDVYRVRAVTGTPRWVADAVIAAGVSASKSSRSSYVAGPDTSTLTPSDGEVLVTVSDTTPCGNAYEYVGCTVTWYSNHVTRAVVYATSVALTYPRAVCALGHEVGHALGLGHVDDTSQLMYPIDGTVCDFQAGDRDGLELMGSKLVMTSKSPVGFVDSVTATSTPGQVRVVGWAADPDVPTDPVTVTVTSGTKTAQAQANRSRPDVGLAFPAYGAAHGFELVLDGLSVGTKQVCVTATNVSEGLDTVLGCRDVNVNSGLPARPDAPTLEPSSTTVTVRAAVAATSGVSYLATVYSAMGRPAAECRITTGTSCTTGTLAVGSYWAVLTAVNSWGRSVASVASTLATVGPASSYFPVQPTRILDSRDGTGKESYRTPWGSAVTRPVSVTGTFGSVTVPADATAVVLNVTVTNTTGAGYLTLWPAGTFQPTVSSLNWETVETVANHVTVPLGLDGRISVLASTGPVHVVMDVVGYYRAASGGASYRPAASPTRILDSRDGTGKESYRTPWDSAATRPVSVTGTFGSVTVPADATAVVLNVTVTNTTGAGYLTLWPAGAARPTASALNWVPGDTRANLVTVPVGAGGRVSVFSSSSLADVVVDIVGWFSTGSRGGLRTLQPTRVVDTRVGLGSISAPLGASECRDFTVTGRLGTSNSARWVPPTATAVTMNVTATSTTASSYLVVYPAGRPKPLASNQNWPAGMTRPAAVEAAVGASGAITICNNAGLVSVVIDVVGYRVAQ